MEAHEQRRTAAEEAHPGGLRDRCRCCPPPLPKGDFHEREHPMPDTTTWEQKASEISESIQQRHTPFKTILDPQYDGPTSIVLQHYARAGDSAIWTGHYLAAEAFRYKVTASGAALENLQRTLDGLRSLVDITGTGLLARCLFPEDWEFAGAAIREECRHGIRRGMLNGEKAFGCETRRAISIQACSSAWGLRMTWLTVAPSAVQFELW